MDARSIRRLNDWRMWSEEKLVQLARGLTAEQHWKRFDIGQGTLLATLGHLERTEEVWLARLAEGKECQLKDLAKLEDLDAITAAWGYSNSCWSSYLARMDESELSRFISGANSQGVPYNIPVRDGLLHVYTHAAYTMAQANNMLKHLGAPPADLSLAAMSRSEHPVRAKS